MVEPCSEEITVLHPKDEEQTSLPLREKSFEQMHMAQPVRTVYITLRDESANSLCCV